MVRLAGDLKDLCDPLHDVIRSTVVGPGLSRAFAVVPSCLTSFSPRPQVMDRLGFSRCGVQKATCWFTEALDGTNSRAPFSGT